MHAPATAQHERASGEGTRSGETTSRRAAALPGVGSGPTRVFSGSLEALRVMHNPVDESAFFWEESEASPLTLKGSQPEEGEELAQRGPKRGLDRRRDPGCQAAPRLPWAYRPPSSECHQRCRARLGVGTVVRAAAAGHAASGACKTHDGAATVSLSAAVPTGRATWRPAAPTAIKEKILSNPNPRLRRTRALRGALRRLGIPETADDPKTEASAAQPPFSKRGISPPPSSWDLGTSKKVLGFLGDGHVM